jgi:hypothetical protein
LIIAIAAAAWTSIRADSWDGREIVKDGVRHVVNPAKSSEPPATVRLEELWRIGGDDEEEGELFGVIRGVTTDNDGFVYVMDYQLAEVKMFSPEGEFVRTLARQGEGPGELRWPGSICISPAGMACVSMAYPNRIVQVNREGEHTGTILLPEDVSGDIPVIYSMAFAGDHVVIHGAVRNERFLSALDKHGNRKVRYYEERYVSATKTPFTKRSREHSSGAGRSAATASCTSLRAFATTKSASTTPTDKSAIL